MLPLRLRPSQPLAAGSGAGESGPGIQRAAGLALLPASARGARRQGESEGPGALRARAGGARPSEGRCGARAGTGSAGRRAAVRRLQAGRRMGVRFLPRRPAEASDACRREGAREAAGTYGQRRDHRG
ncbi:hypothetical protein MC885_008647 [Smutsia gigantea]|nr:hypothetical protein MC885_008647 [Smutsia gigantea]